MGRPTALATVTVGGRVPFFFVPTCPFAEATFILHTLYRRTLSANLLIARGEDIYIDVTGNEVAFHVGHVIASKLVASLAAHGKPHVQFSHSRPTLALASNPRTHPILALAANPRTRPTLALESNPRTRASPHSRRSCSAKVNVCSTPTSLTNPKEKRQPFRAHRLRRRCSASTRVPPYGRAASRRCTNGTKELLSCCPLPT